MTGQVTLAQATQRLGVGSELPGLLAELGVEPASFFQEFGIELAAVTPNLRLPFHQLLKLLERAVNVTGCPHLGLLCGLRFKLHHHGAIGELMQSAPTLRQALEDFVRWQPGYSGGAIVYLHRDGPEYALGYGIYAGEGLRVEILYDVAVAVGFRLLQLLTNGEVVPIEVHLGRRAPKGQSYARYLQAPVRFEQDRSCLVLDGRTMDAPLPMADPVRREKALALIRESHDFTRMPMAHWVCHEIRRALLDGPPQMPVIAKMLGIETRTLRRKLKAEGTTFSNLSDEVRLAVARELLYLTNLSVADVSAATGFASASVFSETFRRWTGTTATTVRKQRAGGVTGAIPRTEDPAG